MKSNVFCALLAVAFGIFCYYAAYAVTFELLDAFRAHNAFAMDIRPYEN